MTVTDEDGQLAAVAEYEGNQVFENSYQPKAGSVVLSAEKVLTGRTLQANESMKTELFFKQKPMMQLARSTLTLSPMMKQVSTTTSFVRKQELTVPSLTMQKNWP